MEAAHCRSGSLPDRVVRHEEGGLAEAVRRQEVGLGAQQGGRRLRRGPHPGQQCAVGTEWIEWMWHRKRRETKQQPSMLSGPAVPDCCLDYFCFLCAIHSIHSVQGSQGDLRPGFVDFDLGALSFSPFSMPPRPNFHLPKQNWADRGTHQIRLKET